MLNSITNLGNANLKDNSIPFHTHFIRKHCPMLAREWKNQSSMYCWWGLYPVHYRAQLNLIKLQLRAPRSQQAHSSHTRPKENHTRAPGTTYRTCIDALFIETKPWKQPTCATEGWTNQNRECQGD